MHNHGRKRDLKGKWLSDKSGSFNHPCWRSRMINCSKYLSFMSPICVLFCFDVVLWEVNTMEMTEKMLDFAHSLNLSCKVWHVKVSWLSCKYNTNEKRKKKTRRKCFHFIEILFFLDNEWLSLQAVAVCKSSHTKQIKYVGGDSLSNRTQLALSYHNKV